MKIFLEFWGHLRKIKIHSGQKGHTDEKKERKMEREEGKKSRNMVTGKRKEQERKERESVENLGRFCKDF